MDNMNLVIGDRVKKRSGSPFLNRMKTEVIVGFGVNENDPKRRGCAIFSNGSVCNIDLLEKDDSQIS
jgi:hypothetical protein